jgi:hypothetical protein
VSYETHKDKIVVEEQIVIDPTLPADHPERSKSNQVLVGINIDNSGCVFDVTKLRLAEMRVLCKKFGVRGYSSFMKIRCGTLIVEHCCQGQMYDNNWIVNPLNNVNHIRTCTTICLINAMFSEENFSELLKLNDKKTRSDYETGRGKKDENFFTMLSEMVGDAEIDLDFLLRDGEIEHEEAWKMIEEKGINGKPTSMKTDMKYNRNKVADLEKVRHQVKLMMKESGHSINFMDYITRAMKRAGVKHMCKEEAFYYCTRCEEFPDFGEHYTPFLDEALKMELTAKICDGEPSSKKSRRVKDVSDSLQTMQTVFKDIGSGIQQLVSLEAKRTTDHQYKEFHDLVKLMSNENIPPEFVGMMKGRANTLAQSSGYKYLQTPKKSKKPDNHYEDDIDSDEDDDSNKWLKIGI